MDRQSPRVPTSLARHNFDAGELAMAAEIIQLGQYRKSRELARMHRDIESRLARLHEIANRLFDSLKDFDRSMKGGPPRSGE